jgi:hypothetical protein
MRPRQRPANRTRRTPAIVAVLVLLIGMMATAGVVRPRAAQAQMATPVTAALVPADAPIYVAVTIDPVSPQITAAEHLLRQLGFGDVVEEFWGGLSGISGLEPGRPLPGGEIGFAVTDILATTGESDDGDTGGVVGIFSVPGQTDEIMAEEERSLAEYARDNDATVERATYNGVSIVYVTDHEASAAVGDFAIFGDRPQDLYAAIDVHAGDATAITENADFAKLRADLPAEALAYAYVDGEALRVPLQQAMIEDPSAAPFVAAILPQTNHRFGAALSVNEEGVQLDLRLAPGTGIAAPADQVAPDLQLDRQISADTLLFVNGVDLGESVGFETLALLVAQGVGSLLFEQNGILPLEPAQYFEAAARVLTFDLRDDFARQLTGEYALAASATSLDVGGIDAVLVSGVDDPVPVADATSKLAVLLNAATFENGNGTGPAPGTRVVDGGLIQVLDLPVDQDGTSLHLEFGVAGQRFLLGYRSGLSDFLAGPDETLADAPRYQEAMAALPVERDWQLYVDFGRLIPLLQQADEVFATDTASLNLESVESLAAVGFTRNGLRGMTMVLAIPAIGGGVEGTPVASPEAA